MENQNERKKRRGRNKKGDSVFEAIRQIELMKRGKSVKDQAVDEGLPVNEIYARRREALRKLEKRSGYENIDQALALLREKIDFASEMLMTRIEKGNINAIRVYIAAITKEAELFMKGQQIKTETQSGGDRKITIVPTFVDYRSGIPKPKSEDFDGNPDNLDDEGDDENE